MNIDQILDEYLTGGPDKRLSLFLYYRELRDEFVCIEQGEAEARAESLQPVEPLRQGMIQKVLFLLRSRSCCPRSGTSPDRVGP